MYGSPELLELVQQMVDTMRAAPGVGLAAPQIGIPLRVRCSCMIGGAGCCKWKTESGAKHHAVGRRCSTCSCLHLVLSPADGPTRPEHVAAVYLPVCPFLTSPALTPSSPPGYRAGGPTQVHCSSPHAFVSFSHPSASCLIKSAPGHRVGGSTRVHRSRRHSSRQAAAAV